MKEGERGKGKWGVPGQGLQGTVCVKGISTE